MIQKSIERLEFICRNVPEMLLSIDEKSFSKKPAHVKWSRKEILGHLIDSASNNHHRIVRGQFEDQPIISYNNHTWINGNHYQKLDKDQIISFWKAYNLFLLEVIKLIPGEKLKNLVETGEEGSHSVVTIEFVIENYVDHLEHHLNQLLDKSWHRYLK